MESLVARLSKLSIPSTCLKHESVESNEMWRQQLALHPQPPPHHHHRLTKTLLLKPKSKASSTVTPLMVIALDSTEINLSALSKSLGVKELRFATEDLVKETLGVDKSDGSVRGCGRLLN